MRSIRSRITALAMTAIVICVVVLGGIGIYTVGALSDKNSAQKMHLTSENAQLTLDGYLNSLQQSVEMACHIAVDSLDPMTLLELGAVHVSNEHPEQSPEQLRQLDAYIADHSDRVATAFGSVANHTHGIVTYYYCINPEIGTNEHGFFYSKLDRGSFEKQPPLDARELDPADTDHTRWYYEVMEKGRPCWVGPYTAHFLNERLTVSYVMPVYKSGEIIGVIGMDILFETLVAHISSIEIYETGFACLLDGDGRILYHPEIERGGLPEDASRMLDVDIFREESSGDKLIRYEGDGEERQLSFSTLVNGQKLVVTAPVSEIASSRVQLMQIIFVAALLILLGFVIYTIFFARAVTAPLARLTAASERLAAGDYDVELDYAGDDEVGKLTNAFRQMSEQLGAHIDDLNARAFKDGLTGVKNKAALNAALAELDAGIACGEERPFALLMFDCNRLKLINDRYGHDKGDIYLRAASQVLCTTYVHSPVFRVGGDEFVVLLRGQDYEQREELDKVFERSVARTNAGARDPWDQVDLAKGMATYRPGVDADASEVLRRADERMYEHKKRHRTDA